MIFRLSQKLHTKIEAGTLSTLPLDENPYADWSCQLFTTDRTEYIIMSNTKSFYSVVMSGTGITEERRFLEYALSSIRDFMEDDGQAFVYQCFIAPASTTVRLGRALNRSVSTSMNELIDSAKVHLATDALSPHELGFQLNDTPLSALSRGAADSSGNPREAFKALASFIGGERHATD